MFLWETGARIGEMINLTVGDIEDRQKGRKVVIDGKTGPRRLPLKESVPHFNRWLNEHPTGEPTDPLWTQLRSPELVSYNYIRQKILQKTADRADIEKPVNPHHYRHSRASYLANRFTEAQLCEWFGWVQGGDQPAKYVHLSGRDIDDAFDALHGDGQSEPTDGVDLLKECARCEWSNEHGVRYCGQCGYDLKDGTPTADTDEYLTRDEAEQLLGAAVYVARSEEPAPDDAEELQVRIDEVGSVTSNFDAQTPVKEFLERE